MSEVEISVGGRRYTIACNPGEEKEVQLASEILDKEADHIVKSVGKVSDIQLLLMSGLMIAGSLKTVKKELSLKLEEISELQNIISTITEENQKFRSVKNNSQHYDTVVDKNLNINENSFEKILSSINDRLSALVQHKTEKIVRENELASTEPADEINSDQQELF